MFYEAILLLNGDIIPNNTITRALGAVTLGAVEIATLDVALGDNLVIVSVRGNLDYAPATRKISIPDDQIAGGDRDDAIGEIRRFIVLNVRNNDMGVVSDLTLSVALTFDAPYIDLRSNNFFYLEQNAIRINTGPIINDKFVRYTEGGVSIRINYLNGGYWSVGNSVSGRVFLSTGPSSYTSRNDVFYYGNDIPYFEGTFNSFEEGVAVVSQTPPADTTRPYIVGLRSEDRIRDNPDASQARTGIVGKIISVTIYAVEDIAAPDSSANVAVVGANGSYKYNINSGLTPPFVAVNFSPNGGIDLDGSGVNYISDVSISPNASRVLSYDNETQQIMFNNAPPVGVYTISVVVDDASGFGAIPYTATITFNVF